MTSYYAVERSSNSLSHYGVKGMKWGVRKAIEKGNAKRLARNYGKALRKLDRLNSNANVTTQQRLAKKYKKIAAGSAVVGGLGGIAALNQHLKLNKLSNDWNDAYKAYKDTSTRVYSQKMIDALTNDDYDTYHAMDDQRWKAFDKHVDADYEYNRRHDKMQTNKAIGIGIAAAGLGGAGAAIGKSALAKYRTTDKGHAKAVAKRNAFQAEMKKTFGTQDSQKMLQQVREDVQKQNERSRMRKAKEAAANSKFVAKNNARKAKARKRLEEKIGKLG